MTSTTHDTAPDALVPAKVGPRWGGFRNLLGKEFGRWWKTRLWWVQALIWLLIVGGITAIVMSSTEGLAPEQHFEESVLTFFGLGVTAIGIGIVVTVQNAVIGEVELGTAAWVLSKPASRASFVVTKMVAHTVGFLLTGLVVASAAFLAAAPVLLPIPIDPGRFALALAVFALALVFYVVLTVALGTLFRGRGPVAGIGVGFIITGQLLKGLFPQAVVLATPWLLPEVATSIAVGSTPDWNRFIPVVATLALTVVLAVVAVVRFRREEF